MTEVVISLRITKDYKTDKDNADGFGFLEVELVKLVDFFYFYNFGIGVVFIIAL